MLTKAVLGYTHSHTHIHIQTPHVTPHQNLVGKWKLCQWTPFSANWVSMFMASIHKLVVNRGFVIRPLSEYINLSYPQNPLICFPAHAAHPAPVRAQQTLGNQGILGIWVERRLRRSDPRSGGTLETLETKGASVLFVLQVRFRGHKKYIPMYQGMSSCETSSTPHNCDYIWESTAN